LGRGGWQRSVCRLEPSAVTGDCRRRLLCSGPCSRRGRLSTKEPGACGCDGGGVLRTCKRKRVATAGVGTHGNSSRKHDLKYARMPSRERGPRRVHIRCDGSRSTVPRPTWSSQHSHHDPEGSQHPDPDCVHNERGAMGPIAHVLLNTKRANHAHKKRFFSRLMQTVGEREPPATVPH
jgi:hypothetical protein